MGLWDKHKKKFIRPTFPFAADLSQMTFYRNPLSVSGAGKFRFSHTHGHPYY